MTIEFKMGCIYEGDNLYWMTSSCQGGGGMAGNVTLVYMDPPYLSQRRYYTKGGDLAFVDIWPSRAAYLDALRARLAAAWVLLVPGGSLVVHVDPKMSHYVKVVCDALFGDDCFASEIVWRYRRWPSKTPNFQRVHDVLLRYVRPGAQPVWNQLYEPLAASTVATWGTKKQRAMVNDGRRLRSSTTEEDTQGVPMGDVWDIGIVAPMAKERTGYPTQKPESLMARIIGALTNPKDLVVDPYMGSGTTLAVASKMGRRYIGIDNSSLAIAHTVNRMLQVDRGLEQ